MICGLTFITFLYSTNKGTGESTLILGRLVSSVWVASRPFFIIDDGMMKKVFK